MEIKVMIRWPMTLLAAFFMTFNSLQSSANEARGDHVAGSLTMVKTLRTGDGEFGLKALQPQTASNALVLGIVMQFGAGEPGYQALAIDPQKGNTLWRSEVSLLRFANFISVSPFSPTMVFGGRLGHADNDSNLVLLNARNGQVIRKLLGTDNLNMTSSYWVKDRLLVSHGTLTDQVSSSGGLIVDRGSISKDGLRGTTLKPENCCGQLNHRYLKPEFLSSQATKKP
jgi:hypothetical protein